MSAVMFMVPPVSVEILPALPKYVLVVVMLLGDVPVAETELAVGLKIIVDCKVMAPALEAEEEVTVPSLSSEAVPVGAISIVLPVELRRPINPPAPVTETACPDLLKVSEPRVPVWVSAST